MKKWIDNTWYTCGFIVDSTVTPHDSLAICVGIGDSMAMAVGDAYHADNVGAVTLGNNTHADQWDAMALDVTSLDDGMRYGGDEIALKLNKKLNVKGGIVDGTKLSENNIGVVSDGTDTLNVKLAKALTNLNSITMGAKAGDTAVSLGTDGLHNGGNKITNVVAGTADTDAINVSQLKQTVKDGTTKLTDGVNTKVTSTTWEVGKTAAVHGRDVTEDQLKVVSDAAKGGHIGLNGKDGAMHSEATLDDGMKYKGDTGSAAVKLDKEVAIVGEMSQGKSLTTGNIGVEAAQDGDNAKLVVKLADNLTGIKNIESETIKATTVNATTINSDTIKAGDTVTINNTGINMGDTKVTNLKAGDITSSSTDAVNGSQLVQTNSALTNLGNTVSNLDNRVDKVGAGAAALAALHPLDFDPDEKWDFAAGYGQGNQGSSQ